MQSARMLFEDLLQAKRSEALESMTIATHVEDGNTIFTLRSETQDEVAVVMKATNESSPRRWAVYTAELREYCSDHDTLEDALAAAAVCK